MKKRYYLLAALATVLFACNKDVTLLTPDEVGKVAVVDDTNPAKEDEGDPEEATDPVETTDPVENTEVGDATEDLVPILLGTSFSADVAVTRAESTTLQSTELNTNTAVGIYIYEEGKTSTTNNYAYKNLNFNTSTATNGDLTAGTITPYYPSSKEQKIDIYAFAPRSIYTGLAELSTNTSVTFTTSADQSSDGYYASDFIWGSSKNTVSAAVVKADASTYPSGKVTIPLEHKGSKIIVNLEEGHGMGGDKLQGASVVLDNVNRDGTIDLTTGVLATTTKTSAYGITLATLSASSTNATTSYTSEDNLNHRVYSCSGVIIPQTITASTQLIKITLSDNTPYVFTTSDAITFDAGKVYTYNITVNATGIALTTNITDWSTDGVTPQSGNATF